MRYLAVGVVLFTAGCAAVGPDYATPDVTLAPKFVGADAAAVGALATRDWWQDYRDTMLSDLIARGQRQSLTLKQAEEAIAEAQALLRQSGVNAALDGAVSGERTRAGGDGLESAITTGGSLDASLVIDLFGGIRRDREAALAGVAAAQADRDVAQLAWLADLIAAYGDARYNQQALELTRQTITTREGTLDITRRQLEAGGATSYELAQAQAALDSAKAALPGYLAAFNANVFAMATLIDEPAGPLLARMQKGAPALRVPGKVATGVPADLLRNRPDVRYAEAVLKQQVAEVGVTQAALYPSITLSGTVASIEGTSSWSYGPSISLPIFNQGALRAARDAQASAARQAELGWRAAVSGAVEDVQVAQSNLTQYRRQVAALDQAAESYEQALTLAQQNFEAGAITLLDLLDTDRSEATARISALSAQNTAAQEWAALQIATGAGVDGGWFGAIQG